MLDGVYITITFRSPNGLILCSIYLGLHQLGVQLVFTIMLFQSFWNLIMVIRLQTVILLTLEEDNTTGSF